MASAPQQGLPLLYRDLVPLSSQVHSGQRVRQADAKFLRTVHAVPLLSEEFILAQRHYPIVFSAGDDPVPLALFALDEGRNVFVDEDGRFPPGVYVPAYVRRYPFILARLRPDVEDLSLCFDPTAEAVGDYAEGEAIFEGMDPSERTKEILAFAESFEQSSQMTGAFLRELADHKLLMDGEFKVQAQGQDQPHVYRGFQMISEESVKGMRGDVARKLIQNGAMPLIYAHFFSLQRMGELYGRQVELYPAAAMSLGMI
jgi:hypothetical protein